MKSNTLALIVTTFLLVLGNILMTTFFPIMGLAKFRLAFNIVIVMYLSLSVNNKYLPLMILFVQYFQSFFTVEGWELGTIAAILISVLISYLRDFIHLSNAIMTMIIAGIFQLIWFLIVTGILYIKLDSPEFILNKFYRFIPECIMLSLITPFIFIILDKIWSRKEGGLLGEQA